MLAAQSGLYITSQVHRQAKGHPAHFDNLCTADGSRARQQVKANPDTLCPLKHGVSPQDKHNQLLPKLSQEARLLHT